MRVATWNTWWRFTEWERRQPLLDAAIVRAKPDVVCLQETWADQAERVAAAAGLEVVALGTGPWRPPVISSVPADADFGNAVLARPGLARSLGSLRLHASDDAAHREIVATEVDGPSGPVGIVSAHLTHMSDAGAARSVQLANITDWLDGFGLDAWLLAGDCNLVPSSDEYGAATELGWIDSWAAANPDDPGLTMVAESPHFDDPSWMADRNPPGPNAGDGIRLDYVWRRGNVQVRRMRTIGGAGDGWPSDHLGLVAEIA